MEQNILIEAVYYLVIFGMLIYLGLIFSTLIANMISAVPFVPTNNKVIKYIAGLADLKPGEKVYDLGCGDGRFLQEAQKRTRTTAIGFETAPIPYALARIRKLLTGAKIDVRLQNFFKHNLKNADVIYCYLGPAMMQKLATKFINECKPGTRIYSHTFTIKSMQPKQTWEKDKKKRLPNIYLYEI